MNGLQDLLGGDYDPLTDPPRTLAHFRVAAAALDRLEDPKGRWLEHWQKLGVNRSDRRGMLRRLKRAVGKKHLAQLRGLAATARKVRANIKIASTVAAEERAEALDILDGSP